MEETGRTERQGMGELFSLAVTILRKGRLMREKEQCVFVGKNALARENHISLEPGVCLVAEQSRGKLESRAHGASRATFPVCENLTEQQEP